jgi:predicted nucleic acid-binding protein
MNVLDKLILDDSDARVFVINNLSTLSKFMTGTVGFMADCCCQYCFFTKEEVTDILKLIEVSGFRVDNNVLNRVRNRVSEC